MLHSAACAAAFAASALHCSCSSTPVSPAAQYMPHQRLQLWLVSHSHLSQPPRTVQISDSDCHSQHQESKPCVMNTPGIAHRLLKTHHQITLCTRVQVELLLEIVTSASLGGCLHTHLSCAMRRRLHSLLHSSKGGCEGEHLEPGGCLGSC